MGNAIVELFWPSVLHWTVALLSLGLCNLSENETLRSVVGAVYELARSAAASQRGAARVERAEDALHRWISRLDAALVRLFTRFNDTRTLADKSLRDRRELAYRNMFLFTGEQCVRYVHICIMSLLCLLFLMLRARVDRKRAWRSGFRCTSRSWRFGSSRRCSALR